MSHALVIRVHFHDGRYHGVGDWPPSPARLLQALVAAAGLNGHLAASRNSLKWFESLPSAPIIGAPNARRGQRVMLYMPNNDLDAVQGNPRRVAEIRTAKKFFSPWLFDASAPFLYMWEDVADADERHAQAIVLLADHLYQFGRGIDMAWARGELINASGVEDTVASYAGSVYRPSAGGAGIVLPCPQPGSLASMETRYQAYRRRFEIELKGKTVKLTFRQAPRPRFRSVTYESPPFRRVYELRTSSDSSLSSWQLVEVTKLVVYLRNGAVERLETALPLRKQEIARVLVGRKPDGTSDGPPSERVRIIPLPSIGHPHADRAIRRVLVEVPAACPLRADDVAWAFSGLEPIDPETGEVCPVVVTPASVDDMLGHYGIGRGAAARTWRTVTPAALPDSAGRRRIDPACRLAEGKGGAERVQERQRAAAAVIQALRHADVRARIESIRVQREPFEGRGERVEAFAPRTRFAKERLWHIEVTFGARVSGPLAIGDGRFFGLGVMAPVSKTCGLHVFTVKSGLVEAPDPLVVTQALRRAVMARVQDALGRSTMSGFFSGHDPDGSPTRSERSSHLAFVFDPTRSRLLIIAPHVLDDRDSTPDERHHLAILDTALENLAELRAGSAGSLVLRPAWLDLEGDLLTARSAKWESVTPYLVTRHTKQADATEALSADLRVECRRRALPEPVDVRPLDARGVPGIGLMGRVRLVFPSAVHGPLLLGRNRYLGGGLFRGMGREADDVS